MDVYHSIGNVVLLNHVEPDNDGDTDWLGVFSNFRYPENENEKLVHRDTGYILDHKGVWRDRSGRYVQEPEEFRHGGEYQYTFHDNGHMRIKDAYRDSQRLEDLNDGVWGFVGVIVEAVIDGVSVSKRSLWGIEDDSSEGYLDSVKRECAIDALQEAREWLNRNKRR